MATYKKCQILYGTIISTSRTQNQGWFMIRFYCMEHQQILMTSVLRYILQCFEISEFIICTFVHLKSNFLLQAQLVNYIQYKALLEGWTSRMWSKYTGVLIWKTQNPWTGLRGQFYDHLHEQTAGFYGCRRAAEPIHVQLNLATNYLEVNMIFFLNIPLYSTVFLSSSFLLCISKKISSSICLRKYKHGRKNYIVFFGMKHQSKRF